MTPTNAPASATPLVPADKMIVDLFAGGGGTSLGIEQALGRSPDIAVNHSDDALRMHARNHPNTLHLLENVWQVDPLRYVSKDNVILLHASPDCRHHSRASGRVIRSESVRSLADVMILWAKTVKPEIMTLENVPSFLSWGKLADDGTPCPLRRGEEFRRWVRLLEAEGYMLDWRIMKACDYGTPTIRERLFIVARRDNKPILWPEPTHGPAGSPEVLAGKRQPYLRACDILDWSIPSHSIFMTREEAKSARIKINRPLVDKTLRRIARGLVRHVLLRENPFYVGIPSATEAPFSTYAQQGGHSRPIDVPMHTICASRKDQNQVASAVLAREGASAPYFVPRYGERDGQEPRSRAIDEVMPTIVPDANGATLVDAHLAHDPDAAGMALTGFCAQHNGGMVGHDLDKPVSTITTRATNQNPVFMHLSRDVQNEDPTLAGTLPYIQAYYSSGPAGQAIDQPLWTTPTKARFGLTNALVCAPPLTDEMKVRAREIVRFLKEYAGWETEDEFIRVGPFVVVDISMRMLAVRELARAQGFTDEYDLCEDILSETAQRHKIGNSVCPPMAKALIYANVVTARQMPDVKKKRKLKVITGPGLPLAPSPSLFDRIAAFPDRT
jgi:DNA (cytosine-5)-methyltransferase 1